MMRFLRTIERGLITLAVVMFAGMILATLAQIVFRYVLMISVPWTEELARTLFMLAVLTGITVAYRERQHVTVDFLFDLLPPTGQRVLSIAFGLLILLFLSFWARGAALQMTRNWEVSLITLPWVSVGYFYLWALVMLALLAIYVLLDLVALVKGQRQSLIHPEFRSADATTEAGEDL